MNRILALENDLRRNTDRLGQRKRRPGPAPGPAPTATPANRSSNGPTTMPGPRTAPPTSSADGSTQQATASALSAWQGTRPPARRTRRRARALSTLDYRVPDLPMPIKQSSSALCWAFVATMMASWRDRQSWTVEGYIGGLGAPWTTKLATNEGLRSSEVPQLLATMGLQVESTQANFTSERWESMLREWGPLWVTADFDPAVGEQGVHAHILVGIHGPSDGNPTVDVIDPWVGREVSMPMTDFVAKYEQLANTRFAGMQIRHWPARAQQAAQMSMSWTRQAMERARQQSAEAVVAGAGLLFSLVKEMTTTHGLSWRKTELRGKVVPGNIEANKPMADVMPYQSRTIKTKKTLVWDFVVASDNVGAEFEISYEWNGKCIANVLISNSSFAPGGPLSGRELTVDTDITQSFANEQNNICAVEVKIVYSFIYARGSAGTYTQKILLFGDGRKEVIRETEA